MQLAAKHVSTPDRCPACVLPADQFAAREAVWVHVLSQFADQSGVQVELYKRPDQEAMVRAWAAIGALAQMDGRLHREVPPTPTRPVVRYEQRSRRNALILFALTMVSFLGACGFFWRIFT